MNLFREFIGVPIIFFLALVTYNKKELRKVFEYYKDKFASRSLHEK